MKTQSLAAQFRHTFIYIITASIGATVLTYTLAVMLFLWAVDRDILPADHYQQQIPDITAYIQEKNMALLSDQEEEDLKNAIQGDQMRYQTVDAHGNILYGTYTEKPFTTAEELFDSFAGTTVLRQGYYIHTVPITDTSGSPAGAVLLFYQIKPTFANDRGRVIFAVILLSLFSPFLYITGFTLLFSKIFAGNINKPLQLLIEASRKIKEKDLDFDISYASDNELGRLCSAFSEMKEALKESLSAQWEMEQERIWMVESLAHDLKSPLSIILGYTDSLIENPPDSKEKLCRYLKVIKNNTEKSADLVMQMQYTSDLENSRIQPESSPVNLEAFLTQKIHDYDLPARQKGIELLLHVQDNVPPVIRTDSDKLARILDNIISNSLQYTPPDGRIHVSVKADKDHIFYTASDTGTGFGPADLKKAADKFYRGDKARQTKGGHSGLGLYIAGQLAEQLGGSLKIENSKSGGACVTYQHSI